MYGADRKCIPLYGSLIVCHYQERTQCKAPFHPVIMQCHLTFFSHFSQIKALCGELLEYQLAINVSCLKTLQQGDGSKRVSLTQILWRLSVSPASTPPPTLALVIARGTRQEGGMDVWLPGFKITFCFVSPG